MNNPIPLPSEPNQSQKEKIPSARPKKPVEAVCRPVKEAVTSELNYRIVKPIDDYQRIGVAVAKKMPYSSEENSMNHALAEEISKAHIQEKKAKNMTYKKGKEEITLDELFVIQNGENHG